MRRKTIEKEAKLREEVEMKKVAEEVKGRIQQEQENHDLHIANAKLKAAEDRRTQLESIKLAAETTGAGIKYFLSDSKQMTAAAVTLSALALGIFGARESTRVVGKFVEARLGKPELVRETSRRSPTKQPLQWLKSLVRTVKSEDALSGVVLQEKLQSRLLRVAKSTQTPKQNQAPFRHRLLYGPPGTGKTLFAKGLARHRASSTPFHGRRRGAAGARRRHGDPQGLRLGEGEPEGPAALHRRGGRVPAEAEHREHVGGSAERPQRLPVQHGEPTNKFMTAARPTSPSSSSHQRPHRRNGRVRPPGLEERRKMIELYVNKYLRGIEVGGAAASSTRRRSSWRHRRRALLRG